MEIMPQSSVEELFINDVLSKRGKDCCMKLGLDTIEKLALFHCKDPRYSTVPGCGKITTRELNGIIKKAYGKLPKIKDIKGRTAGRLVEKCWQGRWEEATEKLDTSFEVASNSIAFEWENNGTLSTSDLYFYRMCALYAAFISKRKGVPQCIEDISLHQWYLKNLTNIDHLSKHRKALFLELMQQVS